MSIMYFSHVTSTYKNSSRIYGPYLTLLTYVEKYKKVILALRQ